jgi:DNA polymerase-3 subunit epsilon
VDARGALSSVRPRPQPLPPRVSAEERAMHRRFIATLGEDAIWRRYLPDDPDAGRASP